MLIFLVSFLFSLASSSLNIKRSMEDLRQICSFDRPEKAFLINVAEEFLIQFEIFWPPELTKDRVLNGWIKLVSHIVETDEITEQQSNIVANELFEYKFYHYPRFLRHLLDSNYRILIRTGLNILSIMPPDTIENQFFISRIVELVCLTIDGECEPWTLQILSQLSSGELEATVKLFEEMHSHYVSLQMDNPDVAIDYFPMSAFLGHWRILDSIWFPIEFVILQRRIQSYRYEPRKEGGKLLWLYRESNIRRLKDPKGVETIIQCLVGRITNTPMNLEGISEEIHNTVQIIAGNQKMNPDCGPVQPLRQEVFHRIGERPQETTVLNILYWITQDREVVSKVSLELKKLSPVQILRIGTIFQMYYDSLGSPIKFQNIAFEAGFHWFRDGDEVDRGFLDLLTSNDPRISKQLLESSIEKWNLKVVNFLKKYRYQSFNNERLQYVVKEFVSRIYDREYTPISDNTKWNQMAQPILDTAEVEELLEISFPSISSEFLQFQRITEFDALIPSREWFLNQYLPLEIDLYHRLGKYSWWLSIGPEVIQVLIGELIASSDVSEARIAGYQRIKKEWERLVSEAIQNPHLDSEEDDTLGRIIVEVRRWCAETPYNPEHVTRALNLLNKLDLTTKSY